MRLAVAFWNGIDPAQVDRTLERLEGIGVGGDRPYGSTGTPAISAARPWPQGYIWRACAIRGACRRRPGTGLPVSLTEAGVAPRFQKHATKKKSGYPE